MNDMYKYTKYNGKPIVTLKPPWYRHHIFPWGYYCLEDLPLKKGDIVESSGRQDNGDGESGYAYEIIDHNKGRMI